MTAIIGGSGTGKTTLSRLIAGYNGPNSDSVTFDGDNIHTKYVDAQQDRHAPMTTSCTAS
ncbi:ATP-binding cassette domain-containing protein [Mycobacterium lepromatosis]|uniref:ATP-binding cassette domain-containing protein n=1 Tax=Mycobacterium lepromatosis TaxID=480418 RepID=UPI000698A65C|nr:ATP-binding cassette domain-containing protein [Mycobacterium lepromatosis]